MDAFDKALAHFGVKGMHWGVRRDRSATKVAVKTRPGGKIKTTGGKNAPASKDAVAAARLRQRARKSKVTSLSNAEIQSLIRRMQLEKQFKDLNGNQLKQGTQLVRDLLTASKVADELFTTVKDTFEK